MTRWLKIFVSFSCIAILIGVGGFFWLQRSERLQWDLTDAAGRGDLAAVERLYRGGADLDAIPEDDTEDGAPALCQAVENGHEEVVRFFIGHNADLEISYSDVISPLEIAIGHRNYSIVELLLSHGASPNHALNQLLKPDAFRPPLDPRMCGLLKKYGAIDKVDIKTEPPITLLCTSRILETNKIGPWLDQSVSALYKISASSGIGTDGLLHIVYTRQKRKMRPSTIKGAMDEPDGPESFLVEAGLPAKVAKYPVPTGYYLKTYPEFKCEAAQTSGTITNIKYAWSVLIQQLSIGRTGECSTDEVREVYEQWKESSYIHNILEVQLGARPDPQNSFSN